MTGPRDATKKVSDAIDFWAHSINPAHQTDRAMNHSLPESKLGLDAGSLGALRQVEGVIAQRIELAGRDVKRRQIR
jgi:hypothetical protein